MARLLSSLPVGAKVVDRGTRYYGKAIVWLVGGHDHYAQGQTVMVSEKIVTLKSFDAKEVNNTDTNRQKTGNNRYAHSNVRQWLNSAESSWYKPQHDFDSPPSNEFVMDGENDYDKEPGFLKNFSDKMRNELLSTSLIVAKNTVIDGGAGETINDKVFLLSATEVGLQNENGLAEGKPLKIFTSDNSRKCYPTEEAVTNSEYKSPLVFNPNQTWYWGLRTPLSTSTSYCRQVYISGGSIDQAAYRGDRWGMRPAINISSNIMVSDTPNNKGEYELWKYVTPIDNTEIGNVTDKNSILKYTPNSYPTGTTVTEKINGVVVGTKTIINDTEYTVSATTTQWNAVKYGKYKDTLGNKNVVTLEFSNGDIYTYPFTKVLPTTAKTNDVLVAANDMANIAMPSHKKKLIDAIGNKATVGGAGTLEDIAKAIGSISVESLGGIRYATGSFTTALSGSTSEATVQGLAFSPKAIVIVSGGSMSGVFFPKDYKGMYAQNSGDIDILRGSTTSSHSKLTFKPSENGFSLYASSGYLLANQTYGYIVFD